MEDALIRANAMHRKYYAADAHFDLGAELYERKRRGETDILKEYIPQWDKIGLKLVVVSVFLRNSELGEGALRRTFEQIALIKEAVGLHQDRVMMVLGAEDLIKCLNGPKTGFVLYLEGLDCIEDDVSLLPLLYELGVRGAALTWSRENKLATGCCRSTENTDRRGSITKAGRSVVKKMKELGMFIDASHLNDEGMRELLREKKGNVLATHSNCRWVCNHYRNLSKELVKMIIKDGGIIGINANSVLLGGDVRVMARHIYEMVKMAGINKVCIGLDLCDRYSYGEKEDVLSEYSQWILLTAHLFKLGMNEEEISKIMGKNLVNYLAGLLV